MGTGPPDPARRLGLPNRSDIRISAIEQIIWGPDALSALPDVVRRIGAERVFIITGRSVSRRTPIVTKLRELLGADCVGLYDEITEHAGLASVLAAGARAREADARCILAVGGGSAIDAGRVATVLVSAPPEMAAPTDLVKLRLITRLYKGAIIPFITVPTTLSAAGSNQVSAVTDELTRIKDSVGSARLKPRATILDEVAAAHTPDDLWATTGIKAIDHCVEIICSPQCNPIAEALCGHAFRELMEWLPRSVGATRDEGSRARCLMAAAMTLSWTNVRLGVSHALAHQIGARLRVPHGVTSCITLPAVMDWSLPRVQDRLAEMARGTSFDVAAEADTRSRARAVVAAVRELIAGLGWATELGAYRPTSEDLDAIARLAHRELSGAGSEEPEVTLAALRELLESMVQKTRVEIE